MTESRQIVNRMEVIWLRTLYAPCWHFLILLIRISAGEDLFNDDVVNKMVDSQNLNFIYFIERYMQIVWLLFYIIVTYDICYVRYVRAKEIIVNFVIFNSSVLILAIRSVNFQL